MNTSEEISRRQLLGRLSVLLMGLAAAVIAVPIVGYLVYPFLRPREQVWQNLGPIGRYQMGKTVLVAFEDPSPEPWAGQTAQVAAWLRRTGEREFVAFAVNCAHLGCPVRWEEDAKLFFCPCHGGVYYANGERASGPPPRGLFPYQVRVENDIVQILTMPLPVAG
jgi:menaquinol-cytochrome c reductase iron-sulfur subunit